MREVEMFPEDFDGVLTGAPAWWSTHQQLWQLTVGIINLPENGSDYIPYEMFALISMKFWPNEMVLVELTMGLSWIVRNAIGTRKLSSADPERT